MNIRGFIETSLLDWDGKVSSVVFLPRCNFRCPYCNNGILLDQPDSLPEIKWEKIEAFLKERKDFIDGVVISGGEPTIHLWLPQLVKNIKALGLMVKLDTNGTHPAALSSLLTSGDIDYVAMDLKAPLNWRYREAAGVAVELNKIKQSIRLIKGSGIDYEFRTTVVPTLINEQDIKAMAKSIAGAKKYALQQFVPEHTLDEKLRIISPYDKEKMLALAEIARQCVPGTIVRGV
jgi:pyruvate formate lyase activating enzyme